MTHPTDGFSSGGQRLEQTPARGTLHRALSAGLGLWGALVPGLALAQERRYEEDSFFDNPLFVLIGVGIAGYLLFAWARGRARRRPAPRPASVGRGSAPSGGIALPRSGWGRRRLAERLVRDRRFRDAGDVYAASGQIQLALDAYLQAGASDRAGPLLEGQGDTAGAAQAYEGAKDWDNASRLWLRAGQPARAARCHEAAEQWPQAAKLWGVAGQYAKAGDALLKADELLEAARAYQRADLPEQAAKVYLELRDRMRRELGRGKNSAKLQEHTRMAGHLYEAAGRSDLALDAYRTGGDTEGALRILRGERRHQEAAELLLEAGRTEEAADLFEQAGDQGRALELRAQLARASGDLGAAARFVLAAGDTQEAADLLREAGELAEAAKLYLQMGDALAAAQAFEEAGEPLAAAQAHERAGNFARAAELFELVERPLDLARVLRKSNQPLRLAKLLLAEGDRAGAEETLKGIPKGHEDFRRASRALAGIYEERGDAQAATIKYRQALSGQAAKPSNLKLFYRLGRCAAEAGESKLALTALRSVIEVDPTFADVRQLIERIERGELPAPPPPHGLTALAQGPAPATALAVGTGPPASEPVLELTDEAAETGDLARPASTARSERYELAELIGKGGMGEVYLARDRILQREVAYKRVTAVASNGERRTSTGDLLKEARSVARLAHPNIVVVYDAGEEEGHPFIVMELLRGHSLAQILSRRGPLGFRTLLTIIEQAGAALAYAHENRIVHRDLKPANLFWTEQGLLKIMDFGLARFLDDAPGDSQNMVRGTPFYMAPEQIRGTAVGPYTDLYALGASLYELACGEVPFASENGEIWPVLEQHINSPPPNPRKLRPDCPDWLERGILWCLQKSPDKRPKSAAGFVRAVQAAAAASQAPKS